MGKTLSPGETLARKLVGGLLWGVSATLSINLFLSFAGGDLVKVPVLVVMAIGLEGAKILTWKAGGSQKILAWVLIGLSVLASFGAALQTVRGNDRIVDQTVSRTEALDQQIRDLEERIANLPPTWLTWYRTLSADLVKLRESRISVENVESKGAASTEASLVQYLADFLRWERFWLELGILMVMAVALEWGALVLTTERAKKVRPVERRIHHDLYDPEVLLSKMKELGNSEYLGGRDRAGKALGWPSYQVKKGYAELVKSGMIQKHEGRSIYRA